MEMETQAPKPTVKRRLRIGRLLLFALIDLIVLAGCCLGGQLAYNAFLSLRHRWWQQQKKSVRMKH